MVKKYITKDKIRNDVILNHIIGIFPPDKQIVLIDVYDKDTGELLDTEIPIFKKDYKYLAKGIMKHPIKPYIYLSSVGQKGDEIGMDYFNNFTRTEKGYLFDLFRHIDSFGRIKYGANYQQYCRKIEDLCKVLDALYDTLRKTLIPKMRKYDLIRTITIKKGHEFADESYISFNPILVTNGVFWDRWTLITWRDVVEKYKLLTHKEIEKILDCEEMIVQEREIKPRELEIWE